MTNLPDMPPDPALVALLDTLTYGDDSETHKRCGSLIRRAKRLGWIRDALNDTGRPLLVTPEGAAVLRKWGAR